MSTQLALSIRQPWAWLIANAGKDIENRDWPTRVRGRVLIHAGKTMTRDDYDEIEFLPYGAMPSELEIPSFEDLRKQCGGIVGVMTITDCVTMSPSPWFCGRYGFVISAAASLPFRPMRGMLGFFRVEAQP